jgi:hypothetical protein
VARATATQPEREVTRMDEVYDIIDWIGDWFDYLADTLIWL